MTEDEILVSFDVVSLFTNVPIGKAIEVLHMLMSPDRASEVVPNIHLFQLQW